MNNESQLINSFSNIFELIELKIKKNMVNPKIPAQFDFFYSVVLKVSKCFFRAVNIFVYQRDKIYDEVPNICLFFDLFLVTQKLPRVIGIKV